VLSTINHSSSNLGKAISIDEFKGNVGTEKYQTIVADPVKHRVFDVLYARKGLAWSTTLNHLINLNV